MRARSSSTIPKTTVRLRLWIRSHGSRDHESGNRSVAFGDHILAGARPGSRRPFLSRQERTQRNAPPSLRPQTSRVPSLGTCLRRFAQGASLPLARTPGSLPGRFALVLRLRAALGLTKGTKKQNRNYTQTRKNFLGNVNVYVQDLSVFGE
jgi:hypothetical protein